MNVCQIGSRNGYRTADHVFVLNTITNSYFKKDKKVYACFVDFQKLLTLSGEKDYCVSHIEWPSYKFIKLIENMYQGIKCSVKLSNGTIAFFNCHVGLFQGRNLSPMLFNLFIRTFSVFSTITAQDASPSLLENIN